jgi:hypothetical protein
MLNRIQYLLNLQNSINSNPTYHRFQLIKVIFANFHDENSCLKLVRCSKITGFSRSSSGNVFLLILATFKSWFLASFSLLFNNNHRGDSGISLEQKKVECSGNAVQKNNV